MFNWEKEIQKWREENKDDSANHNYSGDPFEPGDCAVCGDNAAGLLHAFDERFGEGYFDGPILDAVEDNK